MKKNAIIRKRLAAAMGAMMLGVVGIAGMAVPVQATEISIDGAVTEWGNVRMMKSTDSNVAKWAVLQDDTNLYFYVQQNGGNAWGMPISNTYLEIEYVSGRRDESNQIRPVFDGNDIIFKNAWYGDIVDAESSFVPSQEADKYEVEFTIPKSFFAEEEYTIHYCGASVKSGEIADVADVEASEEQAVYEGIKIDGTFTDWNAIEKTDVDREVMTQIAAVFDGDYLYIYMKENSEGALAWSGERGDGKFTIYTDTDRNTSFKLNTNSIENIEGASVAHSNYQYEIAIPATAIKQYKKSISIGYYMEDTMLLENIVNLQDSEDDVASREFTGIKYDGNYADWEYYPHTLIEYATNGTHQKSDAEAALYTHDTTLYGHVLSHIHMNEGEFSFFTIRLNENEDMSFSVKPILIDSEGNINQSPNTKNIPAGTYEYYLCDISSWSDVNHVDDIKDDNVIIYGKMYVTIRETADGTPVSDEMEYQMDIETMARRFGMDASEIKLIQANYINIGDEWVSAAGTSTGAVMGISICGVTVLAVLLYRKKKKVA